MSLLQNGRTVRGCIQGDSVPDQFIPHLIDLYRAGKLPIERIATFYDFSDINQAVADSIAGRRIKALLRMPKQTA
jgi:aryl-alcohol dehydrogenase